MPTEEQLQDRIAGMEAAIGHLRHVLLRIQALCEMTEPNGSIAPVPLKKEVDYVLTTTCGYANLDNGTEM